MYSLLHSEVRQTDEQTNKETSKKTDRQIDRQATHYLEWEFILFTTPDVKPRIIATKFPEPLCTDGKQTPSHHRTPSNNNNNNYYYYCYNSYKTWAKKTGLLLSIYNLAVAGNRKCVIHQKVSEFILENWVTWWAIHHTDSTVYFVCVCLSVNACLCPSICVSVFA